MAVKDPRWKRLDEDFIDVGDRGTNVVAVIRPANDLLVISNAIRQADVPATK